MEAHDGLTDAQRFDVLSNAIGICIWEGVLTVDGDYLERSCQGLDTLIGEAVHEPNADLAIRARLHPDDLAVYERWVEDYAELSTTGRQYRMRHANGAWRTFEERMLPHGETAQGTIVIGIITDITERARLQAELADRAADLERSNRDLQEFAHVASHDLQEPLRKIMAFGDRLEQRATDLDDTCRGYLDRMTNAAQRMSGLISDLLTFSRVQSRPPEIAEIDLNDVVRGVLDDLEVAIANAEAVVEVDPLPVIGGDALQMRQLFQNLIGNALKFRREGVRPVVRVGVERARGVWQITVEDNGVGFDQDHAAKIFVVFQRLHGRDQFEGSGVGLSVCRRIVERHRGTIEAHGVAGEGARFVIELPATRPALLAA